MNRPTPPIRTLLVEDNPDYALLIQTRLRSGEGRFDVVHVGTLDSALSRLRSGDIEVVLLDLTLPDSSGVQTVARVRDCAPDVPIVVLTNRDEEDLALETVQARADEFLGKGRADGPALVRAIHLSRERHRVRFELERNVQTLSKDRSQFRTVVATSGDGMVVIARDGAILFANQAAVRLFGCQRAEMNSGMFGYPFGADRRLVRELGAGRVVEVHVAETTWDGQPVWLASLFDITEHKRYQADLEHVTLQMRELNRGLQRLANIDPLTDLLNRRGLEALLAIELRRARRASRPLAAVLIDCDDFKRINESLGHAVGDIVLKELAHRLKEGLRPSDHICRVGGDEFLALLPDTRFAQAFQVAERLRMLVSDSPLHLPSGPVRVTVSLAIEMVPDEELGIDGLLSHTHLSLQRSKRDGKNRVSTREARATVAVSEAENLVLAMQSGAGIRVVHQPIVRLRDEAVVGWEMLSRGPAGIFEAPRDFFRVALERNMLTLVDRRCLDACVRAAALAPDRPARCHVNVFPSTLLDAQAGGILDLFPDRSDEVRFCVEIGEQQLIGDPAVLRDAVIALKNKGILFAIGDVGFGRSSLESLIVLEPDVVKIDPKFVQGCALDESKRRALQRLVDMLTSTGSELVAEGIETRADLEVLVGLGVPCGQGFLWNSS